MIEIVFFYQLRLKSEYKQSTQIIIKRVKVRTQEILKDCEKLRTIVAQLSQTNIQSTEYIKYGKRYGINNWT